MRLILEDAIFRQWIRRSLISLILIFVVFTFVEWGQMKQLYVSQQQQYQKIVGAIVGLDPKLETEVMQALFNQQPENDVMGERILAKYGYDSEAILRDPLFKPHLQQMMKGSLTLFLFFCLLVLIMNVQFIYRFMKRLMKFNETMRRMSKEALVSVEDVNEEGIIGKLYTNLNKLSRQLNSKIAGINHDRHSLKELVTDISHQFKTPLASLELYQSLLKEEDLSEEERIEFLQTNDQSILKIDRLIEDLINISRLEAGMLQIKPSSHSLNNTLDEAIESIKAKALQKQIDIKWERMADYQLQFDAKWTEEAIINILDNAIKYTPETGSVVVSVVESPNFVEVKVRDNGMGIALSEYNRIFKRFYRVKGVESIEGSGVGLYLSRKIIESQGGSIMVSSKLGLGSTFSIFLTKL